MLSSQIPCFSLYLTEKFCCLSKELISQSLVSWSVRVSERRRVIESESVSESESQQVSESVSRAVRQSVRVSQ